ncbi:GPI-anchor transamidase subunit GAA1 [Sporobolomyces salmoneus]|uniref:GPI-anchor transamidase subunit GAA1 n=1 Tax=Sporobolomyces salmoneus TaxID=183962 RepID=UPI00317FE622
MASRLKALLSRSSSSTPPDPAEVVRKTLVRRNKLISRLFAFAPHLRTLLFVAGVLYTLALPLPELGRRHYISENALQPAQVNTYWSWADVHIADLFDNDVKKWSRPEVSVEQRTKFLQSAFEKLGYASARQRYSFELSSNSSVEGINTYAIRAAPKTDGSEALVLSASWLSRALDEEGRRRVNTRGISTVLALANYMKKYSMWSKDVIFLISDGHVEGAQAWLDSYHGYSQSNLKAERLSLTTGPIWAALNLDYPHHSFSEVGIHYEGANGQLPNLDFINSASRILRHVGIQTVLRTSSPSFSFNLPSILASSPQVTRYLFAAKNLFSQLLIGADGRIRGPEGCYGKYRIDAITWFAIPAEGPHGFHSIGQAVESTFRSLHNLLERFHQSFFLYIMTSIDSFIAVGNYLAAPILIGAALTIQGLISWSSSSRKTKRSRPTLKILSTLIISLLTASSELHLLLQIDPVYDESTSVQHWLEFYFSSIVLIVHLSIPLILSTLLPSRNESIFLSESLQSIYYLLSGLLISITATLNFGFSLLLSFYLSLPLFVPLLSKRYTYRSVTRGRVQQIVVASLTPTGIWGVWRVFEREHAEEWMRRLVGDWKIGGGWSLPVVLVAGTALQLVLATAVVL